MPELAKVREKKDPVGILTDLLIEVRNTYRFDDIKVMHFTHDRNNVFVRISCRLKQRVNHIDYNYTLNIGNFDTSCFRLMCDEKKLVVRGLGSGGGDPEYEPLDKNAKLEIYYPLFDEENDKVTGALYLCSLFEEKFNRTRFAGDYRLGIIGYLFSRLYEETRGRSLILSFLKLFDDFLAKNNSHMLRHHHNVAYWSMLLAEEFGMSDREKTDLYYAGILHDIGEIYINSEILNKKEKLTEKEFRIIRNHVQYSINLVKQILDEDSGREAVSKIILQHHERPDGKGYPYGLKGREISLQSRILCVADALDSMLSKRSYRGPRSIEEVISEFRDGRGTQFDPKVVDTMIRLLYRRTGPKLDIKKIPILVAELCFVNKDCCSPFQGILIPMGPYHEFHPIYASDLDMVDFDSPPELKLFYVIGQTVHEYAASFLKAEDGIIYLSHLEPVNTVLSDSLFWQLEGLLYINYGSFVQIKGSRISSGAMSFLASQEAASAIQLDRRYEIVLFFENDKPETISGRTIRRFRTGSEYLYVFLFDQTTRSQREKIGRHISEKQADFEMRFFLDTGGDA